MVSILIFHTTYTIMKDSISVLMGEALDKETEAKIIGFGYGLIEGMELYPHHFKIHHYGNHTELTFHIRLPGNLSLEEAHDIASTYEKLIEENLNLCVTIHVDAVGCASE